MENLDDVKDNPNYTFVHGNICDRKLVRDLVKESDCVVNFAAESHVDNSIKHPEIFVETNVQGTLNLLQASKELGVERYLQVSTDEVYGTLGIFLRNNSACSKQPIFSKQSKCRYACESLP